MPEPRFSWYQQDAVDVAQDGQPLVFATDAERVMVRQFAVLDEQGGGYVAYVNSAELAARIVLLLNFNEIARHRSMN